MLQDLLPDGCSLSNPRQVRATHVHLALDVSFRTNLLSGSATFSVCVLDDGASFFDLDTRDLAIRGVTVEGKSVTYTVDKPHEALGSRLRVPLDPALRIKGRELSVEVTYSTSPRSSACQWLPPAQTAGKQHPYLFTQCQAIHARSLLPCQDSPGAKVTWSACVSVPPWATVVMSALQEGEPLAVGNGQKRAFSWKQPIPTSTYLIALAVGDLASRDISPRCRVWSEPSMVERVAYEFAETEKFLAAAESLTCPYVWGRYDVLCLPPSFPYGGMENPCLTFVTPTLLAGDRSLADVVAHEIAHSWTGNLVTNASWEHFWLNEGWTVWLERRIMMRVRGAAASSSKGDSKYFDFLASGGWSRLKDAVEHFTGWNDLTEDVTHFTEVQQAPFTKLVPSLKDMDPDDAFSAVPYEKGFNLLYAIQRRVGDDAFEAFAKHYIATFQSKLISSDDFKTLVMTYQGFPKSSLADLDWDAWFYAEGMPPETPVLDDTLSSAAASAAARWVSADSGSISLAVMREQWDTWSSNQKCFMLDKMLEMLETSSGQMSVATLESMQALYGLAGVTNSEIRFRWCTLCLRAGASFILPTAIEMLSTQGRMKFTRPLYRDLIKSSAPGAASAARNTFKRQANNYHPICRKMVASDFKAYDKAGGSLLFSPGTWVAVGVVGYLAWAVMRVRANKCPVPFVH